MNKTCYFMRGVPGSGKSLRAHQLENKLRNEGFETRVLSTDDYFTIGAGNPQGARYLFDPMELPRAHAWNLWRAKRLMELGVTLIIDNTNIQLWEMRRYVKAGLEHGYTFEFVEATTPWAKNAQECFKRNSHGVPLETIERMLARFEPLPEDAIEAILKARAPWEEEEAKPLPRFSKKDGGSTPTRPATAGHP